MYAGIAAGNNKPHSIKCDKKNLYFATIQAQDTPIVIDKIPTPSIKKKVLYKYIDNLVSKRCNQVSTLF